MHGLKIIMKQKKWIIVINYSIKENEIKKLMGLTIINLII